MDSAARHDSHDEDQSPDEQHITHNGNGIANNKPTLPSLSSETESPPSYDDSQDPFSPNVNKAVPPPPRRQSSFAQSRPNGTPRTPNRVRFNISPTPSDNGTIDHDRGLMELADEETLFREMNELSGDGNQRQPLLTGQQAPMIALALEDDFNAEELLESARPKSGMKMAFMNMANSIMYAQGARWHKTLKLT